MINSQLFHRKKITLAYYIIMKDQCDLNWSHDIMRHSQTPSTKYKFQFGQLLKYKHKIFTFYL